jgi:two-component system nitrogen regulation sensor histidine kinase NtrY
VRLPFSTLRARLMAALVLVAVVPIVSLSLALTATVTRRYEQDAARRLVDAIGAVRARLTELEQLANARVAAIALRDLPAAQPADEADLADTAVLRHDLPCLEVVDASGIVISSHHWPASAGLRDTDSAFPKDGALRLQSFADGYGAIEKLTITASQGAEWRGRRVVVRGGYRLDEDFLASFATPRGMAVAFRDQGRHEWRAAHASPLGAWDPPDLAPRRGQAEIEGVIYRWAAEPVAADLWVVVAIPATELSGVSHDLRRLAAGATGAAVLVAVLAALWLSGWIATPVQRLARAIPLVAQGVLGKRVPESGATEVAELAAAFNRMTDELRESRERLLQAERVAAWREMARRLAHELKNPLFPIQVSIETLRRLVERDDATPGPGPGSVEFPRLLRESCDTILDELRLLRGIIDEFSRFARLPQPRFEPTDVNALVEQVVALYRPRAGRVVIEVATGSDLPLIAADRDLLAHALGNLVANALDAMPEGGRLAVHTARNGAGVAIEVADTGPGIPEKQRQRLFTPYFTTKKGGTGLGLSIAQSIVSDHQGRIEVATAAGEGTTFTILLPNDLRRTAPPPSETETP